MDCTRGKPEVVGRASIVAGCMGQSARVEVPWHPGSQLSTMDSVLSRRFLAVLVAALAVAALCAPAFAQAATPVGERFEAVTVKRYLMARIKPSINSRGAVHLWTNTGFSNRRAVYPVLRHKIAENGGEWLQVKSIRGRKQIKAWIPRWATRRVWIRYRIQVDLSSRRSTIYRDGKVVRRFRVVVGAPSTPTPTGRYFVVDRMHLRNSWARGGWALATSAFSRVLKKFDGGEGQVALHARGALSNPVGTAASHGCVRYNDREIAWMARHVPNGTPIEINR
jgi:lipoprotein-anchoring transpeptidase ErfK/SrfK